MSLFDQLTSQQQQAAGLSGLLGGIGSSYSEQQWRRYQDQMLMASPPRFNKEEYCKPKTYREELQAEIDEWLK
jgi:hypothetical protein